MKFNQIFSSEIKSIYDSVDEFKSFEDEKKMKDDEEKLKSIYRRYYKRLEKLNQEVAINELFLFSILTGRIKVAKTLWKRGKVRFI